MEYKAKRGSILAKLKEDLTKGYRETTVNVYGRDFTLKTLNEDEEIWADQYTRPVNTMSMISSRKAPRLAAAIKAIDGNDVGTLFEYPDSLPEQRRKDLDENIVMRRYWVREQMLLFLSEDSSRKFINRLYEEFEKIEVASVEAIKEIPNS